MLGAPTKPTAVAVPVTDPTRESEGREKDGARTHCVIVVQTSWKTQTLRQCHVPLKSLQTMKELKREADGFTYVDIHTRICTRK